MRSKVGSLEAVVLVGQSRPTQRAATVLNVKAVAVFMELEKE